MLGSKEVIYVKVWLLLSKIGYHCWESSTTILTAHDQCTTSCHQTLELGNDFDYADDVFGVDADGLWDHIEEDFEEI